MGTSPLAGGYAGYALFPGGPHVWLAGTGSFPTPLPLTNDGQWHSCAVTFNAVFSTLRVMLEDWNGVGGFPNGDPGPGHAYFDNVSLASTATGDVTGCAIPPSDITVDVDIKPGSDVNPINTRSKGVIPVAILTTDDFDATTVDASTVEFGPGGASIAHKKAHLEDVDDDGDIDLVMHFRTQDAGISSGDVKVCLTGVADGTDITGCDVVRVK